MTDGLEPPGCAEAVCETAVVAGVDHLAAALQAPHAVLGIRIAHLRIAASLEPVRNAAAVLAVLEVVDEIALRARHDDGRDCHGIGPGEAVEGVGELGIL